MNLNQELTELLYQPSYVKRLIINCDDYGWDAPATQAILELGAAKQVSSTTVMANFASDAELREDRKSVV